MYSMNDVCHMKLNTEENSVRSFDIWLASLPETGGRSVQHGTRPVVVVSNDMANRYSPAISVVPLTSNLKKKALPTHVFLRVPGLERASLALCEQVTTVDKSCLIRRLATVETTFQRMAIRHGLAVQLGMAA